MDTDSCGSKGIQQAFVVRLLLAWWLSWERIHLQCRRPGFDSWVGKIPLRRERLLEYSSILENSLENSMDCIVPGVAKSRTRLSDFHFIYCLSDKV